MEVRVSSQKSRHLPSDFVSESEKKEISEGEDEDDDRNHKHRKRDARSQSLEGDSLDEVLTRPYRKRNKPFENGYSYRGGDTQSGETWKNNFASGREFPARFEKRRPNQTPFPRASIDLSQRISRNQVLSGEAGSFRGRGRELGAWGLHDSRLGSVDLASHMVQPGSVPSSLFAGRGLPNISNAQSASWNSFGLVPGAPNVGLDALHPLGLQAALGPSISPSMNIGIPRQRCRDFEERGFCLRGDICPMEHGVNRIVIDDVQGLSQFNLPVSLPGTQLLGTSSGQGVLPLPVITASSCSLVNSKPFHANSSMPVINDDGLDLNGGFVGCSLTGGSDVYDPDQPLWTSDNPENSALLAFNQSNAEETESSMNMGLADRPNIESYEGFDERLVRSAATAGSQNSSVWGRIGSSKNRLETKEKIDSIAASLSYGQDVKGEEALNTDLKDISCQWKQVKVNDNGPQVKELSLKPHSDFVCNARKPSQKALRTLFVNGIPLKENKMEALLSHFQKFGEVIDIYIPKHGERAFVQFSKREEAEAALKAPDAVMGNRFIKLWWANRDNIPDDGLNGSSMSMTSHGVTFNPDLSHPSVSDKGKETSRLAGIKDGSFHASVSQVPVSEHPKVAIIDGPKVPPLQQKKLENLEFLKEELRKKQEMLDQKRNEFRLQLNKLEKQATGFKDVTASDHATTRLKGETPPDNAKAETAMPSPRANMNVENAESNQRDMPRISGSNPNVVVREHANFRPSIRPPAPITAPFVANRFKLDNRPTAFKIVSPLPMGFANAATLKEHFSCYGDLLSVELDESQLKEGTDGLSASDVSAHISFTTRRSAEKAFLHGKCWRGHNLQFIWLPTNSSGKESGSSGNPSTYTKVPSVANVQHSEESASTHPQKIAALGAGEPENPVIKSDAQSADQDKDSKSI